VLTVPPFVWRAGALGRALTVGASIGAFLGALSWLDSRIAVSGAAVFVILGSDYGIWMGRRMVRYWPAASHLTGSCVYLGLLAIELFWRPRRRDGLLRNADRAALSAVRSIDDNEKGSST